MFGLKKQNLITEMVEEYLQKCEECQELFRQGFTLYLKEGPCPDFDTLASETSDAESACDDIRRQIEAAMYEKALIPESRGDILSLLESLDKVPNTMESTLFIIQTEKLQIPEFLKNSFQKLVEINTEAFDILIRAVRQLFSHAKTVKECVEDVDKLESASDELERATIRKIFADRQIEPAQRILLKELIVTIGSLSDRCENATDTLTIIAVKRLI
ncbi:MAG: DUF47 domain-containing protein [Planctomycetes bacterium]|nr:DUF47 domain-containing protein [Planctomycetota bacterium]